MSWQVRSPSSHLRPQQPPRLLAAPTPASHLGPGHRRRQVRTSLPRKEGGSCCVSPPSGQGPNVMELLERKTPA